MTLLGIKLKQTQQLNQRQQQSLRVLQMSGIELEREVEDWLQDNPLLQRAEADEFADASFNSSVTMPSRAVGGDDAEEAWLNVAKEDDFNQYLHAQVCEHPLTEREAAYIHIIIDFLDEQGYLTDSIEDIINNTPLEWMLDEDELQHALTLLQTFDPPGVAAANLNESLILQLHRLPDSPARQAAITTVNHAEHDGKLLQNFNRLHSLQPDTDEAVLHDALKLIATLNPYPANGFATATPTPYIQPDVWVQENKNGWHVVGNEAAAPQLTLNSEYCELMENADLDCSSAWKEKISEAKQHLETLELRKNTVILLAEYIVKHQADFFTFGEIGLVPLLMKDAAAELGLAESTISRAANQKYLSCPRGLFALRYFFTQAVNAEEGSEGMSQNAIKAILQQIIDTEDRRKPHSDEALVRLLAQKGIDIARRTVTKYRESLDIPTASRRKNTA